MIDAVITAVVAAMPNADADLIARRVFEIADAIMALDRERAKMVAANQGEVRQ